MALPLMPKATAVWLVDNTALSFEQIADFCGMHELEVQAIADGEVATGIVGNNPVAQGQVSSEEIKRCEDDHSARLRLQDEALSEMRESGAKGGRYTPVSRRRDRPDAIAWLLRHHRELSDSQIARLLGTTKPTIQSIRDRSHWNIANIKPQNPVTLGMCTEADLEKAVAVARGREGDATRARREAEEQADAEREAPAPEPPAEGEGSDGEAEGITDPNALFSGMDRTELSSESEGDS